MKKLTQEEFIDRVGALARAEKIFTPHLTKNISVAFHFYQEVLAEGERVERLTKERERDYNVLSNKQRPLCPDCGREMALRIIKTPEGKHNLNGYKTSWICEDDDCCYEKFSKHDLKYWVNTLSIKE